MSTFNNFSLAINKGFEECNCKPSSLDGVVLMLKIKLILILHRFINLKETPVLLVKG